MELTHCNVAIPSTFTLWPQKKGHNYVQAGKQPNGIVQYIFIYNGHIQLIESIFT